MLKNRILQNLAIPAVAIGGVVSASVATPQATFASSAIGNPSFRDSGFYACVVRQYDALFPDTVTIADNPYETELSDSQLAQITQLNRATSSSDGQSYFDASDGARIYNTSGLEKMTSLTSLNLSGHGLEALDISSNTELITLYAHDNMLMTLNLSKNTALANLNIGANSLVAIDLSAQTDLCWLEISYNSLSDLDLSGSEALTKLSAHHNELTNVTLPENSSLTDINIGGNNLKAIDLSAQTNLCQARIIIIT